MFRFLYDPRRVATDAAPRRGVTVAKLNHGSRAPAIYMLKMASHLLKPGDMIHLYMDSDTSRPILTFDDSSLCA